jgi:hypothetical protein
MEQQIIDTIKAIYLKTFSTHVTQINQLKIPGKLPYFVSSKERILNKRFIVTQVILAVYL